LRRLTQFAIKWYQNIKKKYGKDRERRTELTRFDRIAAKQVVVSNDTLYVNRKEGFAGYTMKRDESVEKCSRLDDIIAFSRDGTMRVVKIADKVFIGKDNLIARVFKKDEPKFYNMIYRDGRGGRAMAKRFQVTGVTREKLYDLTAGKAGTRVLWLSEHDSEEDADIVVRVHLKSDLRLRNLLIDYSFGELAIKGRGAKGNILTRHPVDRVSRIPKAEQEEITGKAPIETNPEKVSEAPTKKAAKKKAPKRRK